MVNDLLPMNGLLARLSDLVTLVLELLQLSVDFLASTLQLA